MWRWKPVGNFCDMEIKRRNKVGGSFELWPQTLITGRMFPRHVRLHRWNVSALMSLDLDCRRAAVGCWLLICNVVLYPTKNNVSVLFVCHMNLLPVSLYISTWEEENVAAVWRSRLKWPKLNSWEEEEDIYPFLGELNGFSLLVTTQTHKHDLYTCINVCNGVRATGCPVIRHPG